MAHIYIRNILLYVYNNICLNLLNSKSYDCILLKLSKEKKIYNYLFLYIIVLHLFLHFKYIFYSNEIFKWKNYQTNHYLLFFKKCFLNYHCVLFFFFDQNNSDTAKHFSSLWERYGFEWLLKVTCLIRLCLSLVS